MSEKEAVALRIFDDADALAHATAARFIELAEASTRERGAFSVALAGGSTPKRVYRLLGGEELRARVRWQSVQVFFGDDRCVPPDHPDSNYRMASEALLSRVPLPSENVRRMLGEADAETGARLYERELRSYFDADDWPRFDLVLLGMGDDGHTASLFPYTAALEERTRWVVANRVEQLDAFRLTLSAPAINRARQIVFNVAGAAKAERLREVFKGRCDPSRLPAQLIHPVAGRLEWLVDRAAAEKL